ncbi:MAG: type II secretion system protein [Elusimicrobia bacterium]|nr:type II secretion system protein [Elusimicrobiota bacterium]
MKKIKGFTLTEVIITMMIVIVLSLVSLPIYKGRHSNLSKLAEGYALLGAIRDAQISYYNEYGNFLAAVHSYGIGTSRVDNGVATSFDPVLGINAINNKYFSLFNFNPPGISVQEGKINYIVTMKVFSQKAGSITQIFNITERNEPIVNGANTDLSF